MSQNIEYAIQDFESGVVNDQIGYEAYWLICNRRDEDDEDYKEEIELITKLAKRVIEILDVDAAVKLK